MMKPYFLQLVLPLFSLLFFSSKMLAQSQPPVVKSGSTFRFEEEKMPSASPCAVCVAFSAMTRYGSGNIVWNLCLTDQPKGYLDLRLVRGRRNFKVRLLRDCSNPNAIKVLRCATDNRDDFNILVTSMTEGAGNSHVLIGENGVYGSILKVTIPSSNQIGIELKDGWALYYGKKSCTAN
ncbi:MAG: hypothetical protein IPL27_01630 [Lewinellaceae bacterium]|nr:hypothetical protein [Lewinellaceae bacterium]